MFFFFFQLSIYFIYVLTLYISRKILHDQSHSSAFATEASSTFPSCPLEIVLARVFRVEQVFP